MENKNDFAWVNFYMEFADKLLPYAKDRQSLIEKIKSVFNSININLPKLGKDGNVIDIDPFTVFGLFNKGITNANRIAIIQGFAKEFSVKASIPNKFDGIPVLNPLMSAFYALGDCKDSDIENLWQVFVSAIEYAKTHFENSRNDFIKSYNAALLQKCVKWNLTIALYWVRPYEYINLDSCNRGFICDTQNMPEEFIKNLGKLNDVPTAEKYLEINENCRSILAKGDYRYKNFPELSYCAWNNSQKPNDDNFPVIPPKVIPEKTVRYWLYAPGHNASKWEEFYNTGIIAIGWGEIGNLKNFASKNEMKQKMKECIDPSRSYKNDAHATWQFANEMNIGDIVFVKKGMHRIIGRGVVDSNYEFDPSRDDHYSNIRQIKWTHIGDWDYPCSGQASMKTLTDITSYTGCVEELSALFEEDFDLGGPEEYSSYTAKDFLNEVYMSEDNYTTLVNLLKYKKNVILQGAPGVGKTFAAERLAYSIMGVKDLSRVKMVQFHQSYSYEDFIMGFRPQSKGTGFELKKGPFYNFCKDAESDSDNYYFFIIDEINRGNLSKIFGELFMLIESDKRGIRLQLLYENEQFSIPENVYIIGMMNTADRSLAMLDYALRRRFAFFEFSPAFETEGFRRYCQGKNNDKLNKLVDVVKELNKAIENDSSLGKGFRIGHSYFCTKDEIDNMRLNSIVAYEIIPLLEEYWFDEPNNVKRWGQLLREAIQ